MLSNDEDALICDMAETYHVLDIWALPVETLAVLASGLRENSRIKMKMAGLTYIPSEYILPRISDTITLFLYDSEQDMPVLFTDIMSGNKAEKETEGYASADEFMAARKRILNGE